MPTLAPEQIRDRLARAVPLETANALWQTMGGNDTLIQAYTLWRRVEDNFWEPMSGQFELNMPVAVAQAYVDAALPPRDKASAAARERALRSLKTVVTPPSSNAEMPALYRTHEAARRAMLEERRGIMLLARFPRVLDDLIASAQAALRDGATPTDVDALLPEQGGRLMRRWVDLLIADVLRKPDERVLLDRALVALAGTFQGAPGKGRDVRIQAVRDALGRQGNADHLLKTAASIGLIVLKSESGRAPSAQWTPPFFMSSRLRDYFSIAPLRAALEAGTPFSTTPHLPWLADSFRVMLTMLSDVTGEPDRVAAWVAVTAPELAMRVWGQANGGQAFEAMPEKVRRDLLRATEPQLNMAHPAGRASAWRVVGSLEADLRPGVCNFDFRQQYWCRVEAHPNLWIGRYPVTVAQFSAFIRATGHNPAAPTTAHRVSNEPMVGVSIHDARAFCAWLTVRARGEPALRPQDAPAAEWVCRLPTRAEWLLAAGGVERDYPWGAGYTPGDANFDEMADEHYSVRGDRDRTSRNPPFSVGHLSAVGIFPKNVAPCGALDMAGNVEEWTETLGEPFISTSDGRVVERWVTQGGSHFGSPARGMNRISGLQGAASPLIGFRVVYILG